jgi:hypothetical protein
MGIELNLNRKTPLLLVCAWKVVKDIEQGFNVKLREDGGCVEERMRSLRVIWGRLERVPWYIILGP